MLHTTTDGKNTSVRGTLPSKVVWTVEFMNSEVLSCKKKPPETTDPKTIKDQKMLLKESKDTILRFQITFSVCTGIFIYQLHRSQTTFILNPRLGTDY
jgi:hypothetical protein